MKSGGVPIFSTPETGQKSYKVGTEKNTSPLHFSLAKIRKLRIFTPSAKR
jgi:hypothetical protein